MSDSEMIFFNYGHNTYPRPVIRVFPWLVGHYFTLRVGSLHAS